jgi:hypothetical protein
MHGDTSAFRSHAPLGTHDRSNWGRENKARLRRVQKAPAQDRGLLVSVNQAFSSVKTRRAFCGARPPCSLEHKRPTADPPKKIRGPHLVVAAHS